MLITKSILSQISTWLIKWAGPFILLYYYDINIIND